MIRSFLLGMTALATFALIAPADADWVRLGNIPIGRHQDRDTAYSQFGGPVETLSFTARGSDMYCRSITAEYGNGERQQVYSGRLYRDKSVNTDVRGRERRIERLTMNCQAFGRSSSHIEVAANVGRFRMAWEKSKEWASRMARNFEHNIGTDDRNHWITVGRENFRGRHDSENTFAGWRGRNVDRIALRPVDNDARCVHVSATFANGRTRDLDIDRKDVITRGEIKVLDLPGNERDLRSVDLHCQAVGDRDVTIEVLARS